MAEAGQEERRLAIEKGCYHEGVLAITVEDGICGLTSIPINAKSGVSIIIGKVNNNYCTLGSATNIAMHVPDRSHWRTTPVIRNVMNHLHRWRQTSSWRDFLRLKRCIKFVI